VHSGCAGDVLQSIRIPPKASWLAIEQSHAPRIMVFAQLCNDGTELIQHGATRLGTWNTGNPSMVVRIGDAKR
jgi:hypothetical protein